MRNYRHRLEALQARTGLEFPILAALGGIGLGVTVGGITGALVGYGIPEFEAKRYEGKVVGGGILVSVHVGGRAERRAGSRCSALQRKYADGAIGRTSPIGSTP